jgi:hypothetical protein
VYSSLTKKKRETRLWHFDPSVFQPGPKAGPLERHILGRARAFGKYTLFALAFAYPVALVSLGIMFGGLVFWTSFAGSMGLIWLIIKKTGYAENFASWDLSKKKFAGLIGGFGIALALFSGLVYLKVWIFLLMGAALAIALVVGLRISSNRQNSELPRFRSSPTNRNTQTIIAAGSFDPLRSERDSDSG